MRGRLAKLVQLRLHNNGTKLSEENLETLVHTIEDDKLPLLKNLLFDVISEPSATYTSLLGRLLVACQSRDIGLHY